MTATKGIAVPVDAVLEALDHGRKWTQGNWTKGDRMCLHQGIRVCQEQPGDAFLIEKVAEQQGWGTTFNDDKTTTFDDVKQRLVEHREVLPDELEATFGPQWALIVKIVRQATTLTPEQVEQLAAARAAAGAATWAAAWDAVRAAAEDAARAAAWAAAGDATRAAAEDAAGAATWAAAWAAAGAAAGAATWAAAWDAAEAAAWAAARAAAEAASTRDLIGNTFTQAHYDTLTAPWRAVFPGFDD